LATTMKAEGEMDKDEFMRRAKIADTLVDEQKLGIEQERLGVEQERVNIENRKMQLNN